MADVVKIEAIHTIRYKRKSYAPGTQFKIEKPLAEKLVEGKHAILVDFVEAENDDSMADGLQAILDVNEKVESILLEADLDTLEKIEEAGRDELIALKGIAEKTADFILDAIKEYKAGE